MLAATHPISQPIASLFGVRRRKLPLALAQIAAVAVIVFGVALLSLVTTRMSGAPPAMWSADAFMVMCLLRSCSRRWPTLIVAGAIGQACAVSLTNISPFMLVVASVCDVFEILLCAIVVRRLIGRRFDLSRPKQLVAFGVMAVFAPFASGVAILGVVAARGHGLVLSYLATWMLAHTLGYLIVTPVLTAIQPRNLKRLAARPSNFAILAGFAAITYALCYMPEFPPQALIISMVVLIAFRMEMAGAAFAALLMAFITMAVFLSSRSLFGQDAAAFDHTLFVKQINVAVTSICALAIGATLAHRRRLKMSLKRSLAVAEDARARAVEAIRQAQLAETIASVGYWRLDLATSEITWSPEMYRIWGMEHQAAPPLDGAMERVHPDDRGIADTNIKRAMAETEAFHSKPIRLLMPDGQVRYISGRLGSERNGDGEVVAIYGALIDVTHLRLSDAALRTSEMRYRLLADHSTDIIVRVDFADTILYISPSCRSLGWEPDELIGRKRYELTHPDDMPRLARIRADLVKGVGSTRADREYRMMTKDGSWVWVEGSPSIIRDENNLPIEMVSQLRDVTERRAFEDELLAARDAAESAAKAKSEFLANMSHELRTPLTSIIGFSSLLAEMGGLSEGASHYVQRIATGGQSLLAVVNDILDFSKLEAGQVELDPHPFDPAGFIEETVELLTTQAENKGLTLGLIIDDTVPPCIDADAARLRQVVLNLVGNAIKFTAEGRVSVSVTHTGGEAPRLKLQVADTGPGIPAERRDRLFQRFSQVDGSVSRNHGGTGLGLAICKNLVKLMGGEIGVDSEDGKGSVFWFTIAAPPAVAAMQPEEAIAQSREMKPSRILVVDDVSVNRELVRAMLEPLGHTFVEACNGAEAVEASLREPFDLILMDLQMPGMDGVTAAKAIRANCRANKLTPILALSANVLPDHLAACAAAGMDDHIGKPIQPLRLLTKVAEWAGQEHMPARLRRDVA
jgi:PAS domain S-box-containing protein